MKKLVWSNDLLIKNRQEYANQLVSNLNELLTRFKSAHNPFGKGIDESFAYELVSKPVETFDELLRVNSPIKPIAGKPLDIVRLAELTGINRDSWIAACKMVLPGSINPYSKSGTMAIMKLSPNDKPLVTWGKDGKFILNEAALTQQCELFKVYAESPEQVEELNWFESLCGILNQAKERKILTDSSDCYSVASKLGLLYEKLDKKYPPEMFRVNYKEISATIRKMEVN